MPNTHVVIPDTQVKPGVPLDHLRWAGQFIVDEFADQFDVTVIHLGDHADMPSLSGYDEGKMDMEGRRYKADIEAANTGFDVLNKPLIDFNKARANAHKTRWWPRREILLGNHENRINRAISKTPKLEGVIGTDQLNFVQHGWTVHSFLEPFVLDGVTYAHYFYNPMTGIPYSGMIDSRLKTIGYSFTMGHQQLMLYGIRYVANRPVHGLVAGSFYIHDEDYKGPQGNHHWRGIIVKRYVDNGTYDAQFVSIDSLCRRYEGVPLKKFVTKKYPGLLDLSQRN
jgi:hypothetical protein